MSIRRLVARLAVAWCLVGSSVLIHFSGSASAQATPVLERGVVVESLSATFEAGRAGIRSGDVLLRWSRGNRSGTIESPFDLNYLRLEEASRAPIMVEGFRGSRKHSWMLGANYWGIQARPNFGANLLSDYEEEKALSRSGKLNQAVERWQKIWHSNEKSSFAWLDAWLLSQLAEFSSNQQSQQEYDAIYQEALKQATSAGPVVNAELLKKWANGWRSRGDLNRAEKHYEEAISVYRTLGVRTMAVSNALKDLGILAYQQGKFDKAEEAFRESFSIAEEQAPGGIQVVWSLICFGVLSEDRGDLAAAQTYYEKALAIERKAFPAGSDLVLTLQNLGALATRRGDWEKAESYYRRAQRVAEKLGPNSTALADVLSSLAECVLDRGNPQSAEAYEKRALSIREKQSYGDVSVALSLRNLGKISRVRGDLIKADEYYHRGLAILEKITPPPPSVIRFFIGLGYVERTRGEFHKAEEYFRRALEMMEKMAPRSLNHAETLADLAGALRNQNKLDAAALIYQQAMGELENKTTNLGGVDEDRSRYRGQYDRYRREYVDVLMSQGQSEVAFQMLEGSRGRTLLETLSRAQIDIHQGVERALIDQEHNLQQLLASKSQYRFHLLNEKHTEEQIATIDVEISDLLEQYQRAEADIRSKSPSYAALTQPQPRTTEEIQRLLGSDTTLLEYSLGDERSFVWVVGPNSLAAFELPKRYEIEKVARHVYSLLTVRNRTLKSANEHQLEVFWRKAEAEYPKAAKELSRMILGPVTAMIAGKRLVIVSDGALQYIPFAALPSPDDSQFGKPLVLDHEIVSLPSASVLAELRRQAETRASPRRTVAVFADPVFNAQDRRVSNNNAIASVIALRSIQSTDSPLRRLTRSAADVSNRKATRAGEFRFERLLYTRQEADAILSVTPPGTAMKALDFQANRATALSPALAQYRVVHFATHGLLDSKHPELSGLVLSLVNKQGKPQDGFLELQDIYNMNLPVDLVVLSGCKTGLGEEINGEGLIGLTRGFMYAGATRVVASLWGVSDWATSELMEHFYRAMEQQHMRPAAALRAAQIQMWKQNTWKSPYYWAAFQIQGEWR